MENHNPIKKIISTIFVFQYLEISLGTNCGHQGSCVILTIVGNIAPVVESLLSAFYYWRFWAILPTIVSGVHTFLFRTIGARSWSP